MQFWKAVALGIKWERSHSAEATVAATILVMLATSVLSSLGAGAHYTSQKKNLRFRTKDLCPRCHESKGYFRKAYLLALSLYSCLIEVDKNT
jgi:hypothetical protein